MTGVQTCALPIYGVLKRLGSEALVKRFAVKFLNDPSFQDLTDGLEIGRASCRERV